MAPKNPRNTSTNGGMEAVLEEIRNLKTAVADQMADLEERIESASMDGRAKLRMVELLYNTADDHILELSSISGLQVRPIAIVETLEHIGDPDVRSGKTSLAQIYVRKILRARRSVEAKHLMRGNLLAVEQVGAETEEEKGEKLDMGREG